MGKIIIIIGGGASGLTAAISAATKGSKVIVLEHKTRVGQKILSTGNGKCNLSNTNQDLANYRGNNPDFAKEVLKHFSVDETIAFFNSLGISIKEKNGYLYPLSEQASAILDALHIKCKELGVELLCNITIKNIKYEENQFIINTNNNGTNETFYGSSLILATGGKAAPKSGSDGSGYELAKMLEHKIIKPVPALVGLICKEKFFKGIAGVRTEAHIKLLVNKKLIISEKGELQLTSYGISGIPVFQISRFASRALLNNDTVTGLIDLLPNHSFNEIFDFLNMQLNINKNKTIDQHLTGLLNKKLVSMILSQCQISHNTNTLSPSTLKKLISTIKNLEITIDQPNTFDQAQVSAGGVDTAHINPLTLESKKVRNLYIIGELLDIDGACGGYNLQWAWSTGYIAGSNAGSED